MADYPKPGQTEFTAAGEKRMRIASRNARGAGPGPFSRPGKGMETETDWEAQNDATRRRKLTEPMGRYGGESAANAARDED